MSKTLQLGCDFLADANLATGDHRNVVPTGAVEDDSLSGFGILGHLGVSFTHVLKCWAARAGEKVCSHFAAFVVFADFAKFIFQNNDGVIDLVRGEVGG